MHTKIENTELLDTIRLLKTKARENKATIWATAAEQLSRPRRNRAVLNLGHITRSTQQNAVVLVPGKVLGAGLIKHPVTVGAFEFSQEAQNKIKRAGGKCVTIKEFIDLYPNGSNVKIMR